MTKRPSRPAIAWLAAALAVSAAAAVWSGREFVRRLPAQAAAVALPTERVTVGSARLELEVASSAAEQEKGLGGRDWLAPDAGMIFPQSQPGRPGFWMKGMRFPLDFIYVRDGLVAETKSDVPPQPELIPFFPAEAADAVIEVNAGWVAAHGIKPGDRVVGG